MIKFVQVSIGFLVFKSTSMKTLNKPKFSSDYYQKLSGSSLDESKQNPTFWDGTILLGVSSLFASDKPRAYQ